MKRGIIIYATADARRETLISDIEETLRWFVMAGFVVAVRGVYGGTEFSLRAVRGEETVVAEGRRLDQVLSELRREAEQVLKNEGR